MTEFEIKCGFSKIRDESDVLTTCRLIGVTSVWTLQPLLDETAHLWVSQSARMLVLKNNNCN